MAVGYWEVLGLVIRVQSGLFVVVVEDSGGCCCSAMTTGSGGSSSGSTGPLMICCKVAVGPCPAPPSWHTFKAMVCPGLAEASSTVKQILLEVGSDFILLERCQAIRKLNGMIASVSTA